MGTDQEPYLAISLNPASRSNFGKLSILLFFKLLQWDRCGDSIHCSPDALSNQATTAGLFEIKFISVDDMLLSCVWLKPGLEDCLLHFNLLLIINGLSYSQLYQLYKTVKKPQKWLSINFGNKITFSNNFYVTCIFLKAWSIKENLMTNTKKITD